jgi:hypothetical protein
MSRVSLHDGTTICVPSKEHNERLHRLSARSWPTYKSTLDGWVAVTVVDGASTYDAAEEEAAARFGRLRLALRILDKGAVEISAAVAYQRGVQYSERRPFFLLVGTHYLRDRRYHFDATKRGLLRDLYRNLERLGDAGSLAIRRFDAAYERAGAEDRLIDFWVALESLFAGDDETQELKYKYSVRIAYYLSVDADERQQLVKLLGNSYSTRSAVVHGKKQKKLPHAKIALAATQTENVLRMALKRLITEGAAPNPPDLDTLIARGGLTLNARNTNANHQ